MNINSYAERLLDGSVAIRIIPGTEVCDFCSQLPVVWTFVVKEDSEISMLGGLWNSLGNWAACPACKALIDANDRQGLIERSVSFVSEEKRDRDPTIGRDFGALFDKFFAAKDGPGRLADRLSLDG